MGKHALEGVAGFVKRGQESFLVDPKVIKRGYNPRQTFGDAADHEFKENIRENGILVPLVVQKSPDGELILRRGGRRLWCVEQLIKEGVEYKTVPVTLAKKEISEDNSIFEDLSSNLGKPLNPFEEAHAFKRLQNYGHTVNDIARRIGKTTVFVYERIALINASKETRQAVESGEISIRTAAKAVKDSGGSPSKQAETISAPKPKPIIFKWDRQAECFEASGPPGVDVVAIFDGILKGNIGPWLSEHGLDPRTFKISVSLKIGNADGSH